MFSHVTTPITNGLTLLATYATSKGLVDFSNIVNSGHRCFIFDIDIKEYFSINASKYDTNNHVTLDPMKRSHRIKFVEKLDEYIN